MSTSTDPSSNRKRWRTILWVLALIMLILWRIPLVTDLWREIITGEVISPPTQALDSTQLALQEDMAAEKASLYPALISITGGTFSMGSTNSDSDEWPLHDVQVSDFELGKYEVTNAQFCAFLNQKGNKARNEITWLEIENQYCLIEKKEGKFIPKVGYALFPVVKVNWYGATAYVAWLNKTSSKKGWRLPTEAEWEYAAGGGELNRTAYAGTDFERSLNVYAWYEKSSDTDLHEVGTTIQSNKLGLYDLSGNVWEWVSDRYDSEYYTKCKGQGKVKNPRGSKSIYFVKRILRGGSCYRPADYSRISFRNESNPYNRFDDGGFRVARIR